MASHNKQEVKKLAARMRTLVECCDGLSVSELGRRIGHKSGTAICSILSSSRSSRGDFQLSTLLRILAVLTQAYAGRLTRESLILFLFNEREIAFPGNPGNKRLANRQAVQTEPSAASLDGAGTSHGGR